MKFMHLLQQLAVIIGIIEYGNEDGISGSSVNS